ncbi:hypothetical protein CPB85DRAFT_1264032, partial [Mucidula mucida]
MVQPNTAQYWDFTSNCTLAAYQICFVRRAGFRGTRRYVGTWLCTFGRTAYTFLCCPGFSLPPSSPGMAKAKATFSKKTTDSGKKSNTRRKTDMQKKSDNVKAAPNCPPANGKKRPAGPMESVPPVGTAQRINKRKPLLADVDPDAPSSGKEEEEQPPKKKKRSASPARKQKEAEKKKQRKKKSTED